MRFDDSSINGTQGHAENPKLPSRTVAVYTTLYILNKMQERLGTEAMAEFLSNYTRTVELLNPRIKEVVNEELSAKALRGLYESLCANEK